MDALLPQEHSDEQQKNVRSCYADVMSSEHKTRMVDDLRNEDRFDLSSEQAFCREYIAGLVRTLTRVASENPGRPEMLIPIQAEIFQSVGQMAKTFESIRKIETAGNVFTTDKVAALLDKVASLVVYHISDLTERQRVLSDISDLTAAFRRSSAQGTLITPDQDAVMMDDTVPAPFSLEDQSSSN